jgi:hypothetical protein
VLETFGSLEDSSVTVLAMQVSEHFFLFFFDLLISWLLGGGNDLWRYSVASGIWTWMNGADQVLVSGELSKRKGSNVVDWF